MSTRRNRLNSVREVCEAYLDRGIAGKDGGGWHSARVAVRQFMAAKGDITLDDLICDDLEQWIKSHSDWKSNWTKKRVAQSVKRAFSWAWNKGLIGSHPLKGVSYSAGDNGEAMTGRISTIALAAAMGVSEKLAFKWLRGQCRPRPEMQEKIFAWLRTVDTKTPHPEMDSA